MNPQNPTIGFKKGIMKRILATIAATGVLATSALFVAPIANAEPQVGSVSNIAAKSAAAPLYKCTKNGQVYYTTVYYYMVILAYNGWFCYNVNAVYIPGH